MLCPACPGKVGSASQDLLPQEAERWPQVTRAHRACLPPPPLPAGWFPTPPRYNSPRFRGTDRTLLLAACMSQHMERDWLGRSLHCWKGDAGTLGPSPAFHGWSNDQVLAPEDLGSYEWFWRVHCPVASDGTSVGTRSHSTAQCQPCQQTAQLTGKVQPAARTLTYTVLPIRGPVIPLLAQALEGADAVDALAVPTHLPHQG